VEKLPEIRFFLLLPESPQCFNGDIQTDLVAIFEAVGQGLCRRIDANWDLVDSNNLYPRAEPWLGIPENSDGKSVDLRRLPVAGAASDAPFESRNQASLSTGDGGAGCGRIWRNPTRGSTAKAKYYVFMTFRRAPKISKERLSPSE
jgi:hypothetical protein